MSVGRIATRVVATAAPGESVLDVAQRMEETNVGSVVVVEGADPVGLLTDRDLVTRVLAKELNAAETPVSEVMSKELRTVDESTPIEQAVETMREAGTRRLVVTGPESKLVGILSIDDVMELLAEEAKGIGELLRGAAPTF